MSDNRIKIYKQKKETHTKFIQNFTKQKTREEFNPKKTKNKNRRKNAPTIKYNEIQKKIPASTEKDRKHLLEQLTV